MRSGQEYLIARIVDIIWKSLTFEGVSNSTFEISERDQSDLCLAMTGDCFEHFILDERNDVYVKKVLSLTRVYARMSPEQKAKLVDQLKAIGYCVAMVGDGNNDVSALASSDVGISLSNADASVAAAFTANQTIDIDSILHVIREGRTALVTSYSCFKYMAVYSLTQFSSISILYFMGSSLADFQFLYIDLLVVLPLALTSKFF